MHITHQLSDMGTETGEFDCVDLGNQRCRFVSYLLLFFMLCIHITAEMLLRERYFDVVSGVGIEEQKWRGSSGVFGFFMDERSNLKEFVSYRRRTRSFSFLHMRIWERL